MPPSKPKTDSFSLGRNPIYEKVRDILKEIFEGSSITIHPNMYSLTKPDEPFDLRQLGYDVCEVNTKYHGFKSDLLLYRSQKKDKGYISINIRGRRRSDEFRRPKDLRVIDIILSYSYYSVDTFKKQFSEGNLIDDYDHKIKYYGFK